MREIGTNHICIVGLLILGCNSNHNASNPEINSAPAEIVNDKSLNWMPYYVDRSREGLDWQTKYLDENGQTKLVVDGYGEEFHEGYAVLIVAGGQAKSNENKSYGFIDQTGKLVVEPKFGEAFSFSEGLAAVRDKKTTVYGMGDFWGYIGKDGNCIIEPIYNEARSFRDGTAFVHQGGVLNETLDAPPNWDGGTWWIIDSNGEHVSQVKGPNAR